MNWKSEYKVLLWMVGLFLFAFFLPMGYPQFRQSVFDALALTKWYAQEHVLLCLVPAFFIAGTIAVFISQASVIRYFGAGAKKWLSYAVASVSGSILAVCSCTVLLLFSGIYMRGAGLGPAIAFLYSGPAINILAIILTARVLGLKLGIARVVGAVVFAIVIGLIMHFVYRKEEREKAAAQLAMPQPEDGRPFWQTAFHFVVLVGILVFATWGEAASDTGLWSWMYAHKWTLVIAFGLLLMYSLIRILEIPWWQVGLGAAVVLVTGYFFPGYSQLTFSVAVIALGIILSVNPGEPAEWMSETWEFTKQIMPLLGAGVLVAGFLLGMPGSSGGIIPDQWIVSLVGGNSLGSNFFASIVGAFMYFATLTEIPILQGLISNGMGQGPALALLLAGPAVSLPNLLVIRSVIGTQKTSVFFVLVVIMATISGMIFGVMI
ncbi:MAG: permease [Candidatus Marinimicrobia bacterium]|nr:permease [Candidatus Neomarinimicrobiota bacterium]MCF7828721.1 permease [Candidatus Neomarinimicrobiota bacterium]MCF7880462.1 permease [Candidatus Neomarinimicrobiota bacterium]